jgi:crotonobetainyl-CoA:carnitine CoA-transferase CaiB-like acyl-CoA transferase
MSALEGIRVIDLTEALAGPYCTMLLGDLGADVIKIERPDTGDQSRKWGPPFIGTESAYFLSVNRNKRSVALNIKSADGQANLRRLLETADVFICNVRRLESLREVGLDPETVRANNPRLIYCSITAYGRTGPYVDRGGYDLVAQGEAGLMDATGEVDGEPLRWPVAIADLSCGLWSANAIVTALYVRERTGKGQFIDQALLDGQLGWAAVMAAQYFATEQRPQRLGNQHANIVPYQVFKARDKHMVIAVGTQGHWMRFCEALGIGEAIRDDARYATNAARLQNRADLCAQLASILAEREAAYWLERLRAADIPSGPVNALDEALNDPQVRHRGMIVDIEHPMGQLRVLGNPLHLSDTPVTYRLRPPLLGEHTAEVLEELGATIGPIVNPRPSGVQTSFRARKPRYAAELAVHLSTSAQTAHARTINLSQDGLAVRSFGPLPRVGEKVRLRAADDSQGVEVHAIVRWATSTDAVNWMAGLELVEDEATGESWGALVNNAIRADSYVA